MTDPGLPPRPRSLNLLESLVKEEEEKARNQEGTLSIVIPSEGNNTGSPEFFDTHKQQITREASASSFSEFKMKDTTPSGKVTKGNPTAGFKGHKLTKRRSRSNSAEGRNGKHTKQRRPFSSDYNEKKRNGINHASAPNGQSKSSRKGRSGPIRKGQRPRSPKSYSTDSFSSSDEEDTKKKQKYKYDSDSTDAGRRKRGSDGDSFFDSDQDSHQNRGRGCERRSSSRSSSSSSDTYTSNDNEKPSTSKQENGERSCSAKTVYVDKDGKQRDRSRSESSDYQRMVVVEDYSSSISSSEEDVKPVKPTKAEPKSKSDKKPLLNRKKKQTLKIFQIAPDLYLEGKLQQKYCELDELMNCSFVDQRSHMTRHHLYQMELIRDQYQSLSQGRPSSAIIIPRSMPGEFRSKQQRRPSSGRVSRPQKDNEEENYDKAYSTIRSVMVAEHARQTNRIRTDIYADRPTSGKKAPKKKKKKIEATLTKKHSDTEEEETSERPSVSSKASSGTAKGSAPSTPGRTPAVDHHIKYSENEKLKKWLKEKDKVYRQQLREEKKKKRAEREKVINEANEKIEKRIKSQKVVKRWMHEKNKELYIKHREEKKREALERKEFEKRRINLPGDSMQIRNQSAASNERLDSVNEHEQTVSEIHQKRETEEEKKQEKLAHDGGPHPPQTKFIYKRPVAGKIKLKMQVRGKSPVQQRPETPKDAEKESEKARAKQMRMSYDEWIKKKHVDDAVKRREAARQKELAKSDPELERIIPALGRKRVEDKLNMRKRIDTGLKKFDDETNKSFGGGDFNKGDSESERPKTAYRLEGDPQGSGPVLSVKQIKRPSTAPVSRGRVPHPKQSENSPRKAIIPQRVDKVMSNNDGTNPFKVPFPPEKGVPPHVAAKQRRIFAENVTQKLNDIEQEALLNAELIKEGVSKEDIEKLENTSLEDFESKMAAEAKAEKEKAEAEKTEKKTSINELMYSPRKREDSSESSEEENAKEKEEQPKPADETKDNDAENKPQGEKNHYKTFENLNELSLDSPRQDSQGQEKVSDDSFSIDIEKLKEKVEALKMEPGASQDQPPSPSSDENKEYENDFDFYREDSFEIENTPEDMLDGSKIEVINNSQSDQPLVGILKETKKVDEVPVPQQSEEPKESAHVNGEEKQDTESGDPDLEGIRKRVSFNEKNEVFESFDETSSTATNTPEQEEFDPSAESLENQPNYYVDEPDWGNGNSEKPEGETLSFNIAGFQLNPTVIGTEDETKESKGDSQDSGSTFITDPGQ